MWVRVERRCCVCRWRAAEGGLSPGSRPPACVAVGHRVSWLVRVCVCVPVGQTPRVTSYAHPSTQSSFYQVRRGERAGWTAQSWVSWLPATDPLLRVCVCVCVCVCARAHAEQRARPPCPAVPASTSPLPTHKLTLPGHCPRSPPLHPQALSSFRREGETTSHPLHTGVTVTANSGTQRPHEETFV